MFPDRHSQRSGEAWLAIASKIDIERQVIKADTNLLLSNKDFGCDA